MELAIELSREIIEDPKDDIQELRNNNKKLMDNKNVLRQELENAYGKMISEAIGDGVDMDDSDGGTGMLADRIYGL